MRVYDVIKTAEDTYISETSRLIYPGMCWCLKVSAVKGFDFKEKNRKGRPSYKDLVDKFQQYERSLELRLGGTLAVSRRAKVS